MAQTEIRCPNCGTQIEITEQLATPMLKEEQRKHNEAMARKDAELAQAREIFSREKQALDKSRADMDAQIAKQVATNSAKLENEIAKREAEKAQALAAQQMKEKAGEIELLKTQLKQNDEQLDAARKQQLEFMQKERALEQKAKAMELEVETRLKDKASALESKLRADLAQETDLKVQEREDIIGGLRKQIESLKQRAEQGSQQTQGESLELVLETKLRETFPFDNIKPVSKGVAGADILQEVMSPTGKIVGKILWETKRTKAWHATWLPKLREDQRLAGADLAVLMSTTLPQEIDNFGQIDNVWITAYDCAISLATSLRINLIELANLRIIREGEASKKELIYDYLTGPEFARRVEAIVEKFSDMQADLQKEKKWMQKMWAKREKQIEGVISTTAGMYGDLEGLAGQAMPMIEGFEPPLLDDDSEYDA